MAEEFVVYLIIWCPFNVCVCMHVLTLLCRDTGLDWDYIIEGETAQDILIKGAEHAMKVHGMKVRDYV